MPHVGPLRGNINDPKIDLGTYRYEKSIDSYSTGDSIIPYVIEAGFAVKPKINSREFRSGLNWSPSLGRLFINEANKAMNDVGCRADDPVSVILHVATPVVNFTDRGKANVTMHPELQAAVVTTLQRLVGPWAKTARYQEKRAIREYRDAERAIRDAKPNKRRSRRDRSIVGNGPLIRRSPPPPLRKVSRSRR